MKIIKDDNNKTLWQAETPEESAAIQHVQTHVSLFAGIEGHDVNTFLAGVEWAKQHGTKSYERVTDTLSEDDKMAVILTVKDWKAIMENMGDDADAESLGPAESALFNDSQFDSVDPTEDMRKRAYDHDYERTAAHESAAGTQRCVDVIAETLVNNGWSD